MSLKPFLKWAGGKRWLVERRLVSLELQAKRYVEPFLGGGAVFFHLLPDVAILSDVNAKLIDTYDSIRREPDRVYEALAHHAKQHSPQYYYKIREMEYCDDISKAARFLYLNRTCWNGLYRENKKGEFNVPIGDKEVILSPSDDFHAVSRALGNATLLACDFEETIDQSGEGDLLFVDPPYTTAHNFNGFVKYNQNIFSWDDQIRLRKALERAASRGASIVLTNADHPSIAELYKSFADPIPVSRFSVIAGQGAMRKKTTEAIYLIGG